MQNRFLYFPNDERPTTRMLAVENLALWQTSGSDYRGLISTGNVSTPQGTVIIFSRQRWCGH